MLQDPQLQLPEPSGSKLQRFKGWLAARYSCRNIRDTFLWRTASGSTAAFGSLSMLAAVLGVPTGFGTAIDIIIFLTMNLIAMSLAAYVVTIIFSLLYIPVPRRFASVLLYVALQTYLILYFADFGILMSIVLSAAFALIGSLAGCLLGLLLRMPVKPKYKGLIGLSAAILFAGVYVFIDWPGPAVMPQREAVNQTAERVQLLQAPDPADWGNFAFESFTYGSGKDKHRAWFSDEVDVLTTAVDASSYITKWPRLKKFFWGFDQHQLPLNGQVWLPKGEGEFPLVLIVHGNHLMEHFSDSGYAYIGELLASKGMIAVSVDENFFNYSVWSGIPNHDMKMRAWLLLKHLQQIKQLNSESGNPFEGRVDFSRVALIGHSRGGQAVAMAADADRWFKDDQSLDSLAGIHIESVVAIAPTDKKVDDKSARLVNVNYLTLQGGRDADVNNFYGDRQYTRTIFDQEADKFKAALYIADANHSQFNTDWGRMDERSPGGLFLDRESLMEGEEQRQISKVYISAFLQVTLQGQAEYKELFRDYRSGMEWLPETVYTNRYEDAEFIELTRFDDGNSKAVLKDGGKASVEKMTEWKIAAAEDRDRNNKGTKGIELEWEDPGAEYKLELSSYMSDNAEGMDDASLVFSMANLERDLISPEKSEDEQAEVGLGERELPPLPLLDIELTTKDGRTSALELEEIMPVQPSSYIAFMSIAWLEKRVKDKKYKEAAEPVFQTYIVPIEAFESEQSMFAAEDISRITFHFRNGPGKVMLDDIGFMPL
ncbi:alpha/beta hydrolase family protein [Paenibacillus sp. sgz302251]|uniref:alpha/beta hydrolase family protein n=1 Tax=Paenibacillus sp. sgz302251 TaxID=3414493 RepID=UPI003C7AC0C1